MQALVVLGMIYAASGLAISLVSHVLSIFGYTPGGQTLFFALHIGIFPVFGFMMLLYGQRMLATTDRRAAEELMLSGCPRWMRLMVRGFTIYTGVNFAIFILLMMVRGDPNTGNGVPPEVWRGFSGHWMLFYAVPLAALTTVYTKGIANLQPKCPLGHDVGLADKFCPTCGSAIDKS
jgi:hypothetical protein